MSSPPFGPSWDLERSISSLRRIARIQNHYGNDLTNEESRVRERQNLERTVDVLRYSSLANTHPQVWATRVAEVAHRADALDQALAAAVSAAPSFATQADRLLEQGRALRRIADRAVEHDLTLQEEFDTEVERGRTDPALETFVEGDRGANIDDTEGLRNTLRDFVRRAHHMRAAVEQPNATSEDITPALRTLQVALANLTVPEANDEADDEANESGTDDRSNGRTRRLTNGLTNGY